MDYDGKGPADENLMVPGKANSAGDGNGTKRRRRRRRRRKKNANGSENTNASVVDGQSKPDQSAQNATENPHANGQATATADKRANPGDMSQRRRSHHSGETARKKNRFNNRHSKRNMGRKGPAYAALDLGTNNCRLLVAVPDGSTFRVIDAFSRIVRLGEGITTTGRLSDAAMNRAVGALKVCASKLKGRGIKQLRLIATEACRIADNGEEFLSRVKLETGLELEIVNRETEARLAVAGCTSLIDREADGVILFDIGGGSSELVWIDLKDKELSKRRLSKRVRTWASLPVGVVNISERHGGVHVTPDVFEGMVEEVSTMLEDFPEAEALSTMVNEGRVHMLGTSGTVTTLAGVHLGLEYYDRRKVDGIWMSGDNVSAMTNKLLSMSFDERSNNACIGKERADLVLAGCAILEALRRKWPCKRLRVADRGLREGILYEMMSEDGVLKSSRSKSRHRKRSHSGKKYHNKGEHNNARPQAPTANPTQAGEQG